MCDPHYVMTQVWDMVEERALQLAPPPGVAALDPLMQLQQNLAALNQVNQAIGEIKMIFRHLSFLI